MRRVSAAAACFLLLLGCKKEEAKPAATTPAAQPAQPAQPAEPAQPAQPAQPTAAAPGKKESDDACVGPLTQNVKATVEVGGVTYERDGAILRRTAADPDDQFVFGVISDIKEDAPENLANIKAATAFFAENKADAILFLGDSSETQAGVTKVLSTLAESGLPVFAIVGNRECKSHWVAGMAEAQKTHKNLFDFTQIRLFNADDVSVISIPGYHNPTYLHCPEGCRYFPSDVEATAALVKQATGTPVLISHGPPRQEGATAIDRIHDEANVGDPALAEFIQKNNIPFGAFGNIAEAGGKATDLAGKTVIAPDTLANSLYLNPGPADAIQWQMLDGTTAQGMAAVLTIKGKQASYKTKRFGAPAPAAAPKK
ncbi:MAG: metallophosphoesterase [Myxococcota bacterium]